MLHTTTSTPPPVHVQRPAPATPSSTPAWGAAPWLGGVPKELNSIAKPQGFTMYPFYQRCLLKLSLLFPGNTLETPLALSTKHQALKKSLRTAIHSQTSYHHGVDC